MCVELVTRKTEKKGSNRWMRDIIRCNFLKFTGKTSYVQHKLELGFIMLFT